MTPHISQNLSPEENSFPFSTNFYTHDPISVLQINNFLMANIPDPFSSNPSSLSNSSTSDEADADEQLIDIINERKRRRMISNRESARRSRIRKQKQVDELLSQLAHLRTDNQSLLGQLNQLAASHEKAVKENARLKEETIDIRQKLDDVQIANISSDIYANASLS